MIDENTIAVGAILGTTFTGQVDEIAGIDELLRGVKEEKGWDIPIHVDGASGGFIAPFSYPELEWDFRLEQVRSINVSNHKFGLVYPGMGTVVFRDFDVVPEELVFKINYLGGEMANYSLNFSRASNAVLLQYYNFLRLGREGYRKIHEAGYQTARFLADEIAAMGPFELIHDGRSGIPGLAWKLREDRRHPFTLFDLADRLRVTGWQVPAYTLPPNRQDLAVQRILVRHGFSRDLANLLLDDYRRALRHLDAHPHAKPLTKAEASGFRH
jgi:glutamate decarboxylase